ncbi:hypothetical protein BGZ46_004576 [Entomortierella lignicola]|nr:hypothetical protein BGZ46_004576 [Entomortierella lignicola]
MVAPVQNLLAKSMLTHIGLSLTVGSVAAFGFWHGVVIPNRAIRDQYYIKVKAEQQ